MASVSLCVNGLSPVSARTFKVLGRSKDEEASGPKWPRTLGQGFGLPPSAVLDLPAGNKAAGPQGRLPFWLRRPASEFLPPVQRLVVRDTAKILALMVMLCYLSKSVTHIHAQVVAQPLATNSVYRNLGS